MLTYLARNDFLYIEYDVHPCARFQNKPKISHANSIERIRRYLLGTIYKGLRFKPKNALQLSTM